MIYLDPSFTEIKAEDQAVKVALAAHNCYQVEKNDDPEGFLLRLKGFKHFAMFEHARFVINCSKELYEEIIFLHNRFIDFGENEGKYYLSFSYRPLLEDEKTFKKLIGLLPSSSRFLFTETEDNNQGRVLTEQEISSLPYPLYKKLAYVSLRIVTDRGVTHELVRHRLASYAQESTRYCNYAKDKFSSQLTIIRPLDYQGREALYDQAFKNAEDSYFALLKAGATPEQARAVLPTKLKATIIITASIEEYETIFFLRCSNRAHPDMRQVMEPIQDYFLKEGYLKNA
ncbi:MAG: FAD-dependent thymidylate synthase [Bacilli bacterium]|jgi:thymidylate synthase (FAD)|nr:FAD-dependent thymidylate synthase [Bacilli bacterium]